MTARKRQFDGRTVEARRARTLTRQFEKQFAAAGVGADEIGLAERITIDTAVMLVLQLEAVRAAQQRGETVESDHVIRLAGAARRVLAEQIQISAKRRAGKSQTLNTYIASKGATL